MKRDIIPAIIGGIIGLAISGYALFYVPMSRNYEECGKVTLCDTPARTKEAE